MNSSRVSLFLMAGCIGWGAAVIWLSLTPSPPKLSNSLLGWDKLQHASAYCLLTILALFAFAYNAKAHQKAIYMVLVSAALFGGLIEVAQGLFTRNRSAEFLDFLADCAGISVAYLLCRVVKKRIKIQPVVICSSILIISKLSLSMPAFADDHIFNSLTDIRREFRVLGGESLEIIKTPFDTDNNGMLGALAVAGAVTLTTIYDDDIHDKLATKKGKNLDRATGAGSLIGNPFVHIGIAGLVYTGGILADSPKYRELGEMYGEAAILADATSFILKEAIGRGRPNAGRGSGSYSPFGFKSDYDSLPSMHTASSFAMASVTSATSDNFFTRISAYAAATFVGFSRMYQNKHWASDVILGAVIGEICGRVVTSYHASGKTKGVAVMPIVSDSSAGVALVGRF